MSYLHMMACQFLGKHLLLLQYRLMESLGDTILLNKEIWLTNAQLKPLQNCSPLLKYLAQVILNHLVNDSLNLTVKKIELFHHWFRFNLNLKKSRKKSKKWTKFEWIPTIEQKVRGLLK